MDHAGGLPHAPSPHGEELPAFWDSVFRRALYLTGYKFTAEDVTQETFARYYARPPERDTSLIGWLMTVCSHLCFDPPGTG